MEDPKALTATQIRFLRIGPRVNQSKVLKQQLYNALQQEKKQQGAEFSMGVGNLNKIPKYGYSQLSKTVNNFGVLINHNFGNSSSLHQKQKFGKLAKQVDKIMQFQKDKQLYDQKKISGSRANQNEDNRKFIKSIYNYQGQKIFAILHSFSVQAIGQNYKQVLPFSHLRLLVQKVNSSKLARVIQNAFRLQTQQIQINYQKLLQKASVLSNSEQKYQNSSYKFQKLGTQIKINLPYLQFSHIESDFKITTQPLNKDILDILNEDFDNVNDIVYKYFDHDGFFKALGQDKKNNQNKERNNSQSMDNQIEQQSSYAQPKYGDKENNQQNQQNQGNQQQQNQNQQQIQDENHHNQQNNPNQEHKNNQKQDLLAQNPNQTQALENNQIQNNQQNQKSNQLKQEQKDNESTPNHNNEEAQSGPTPFPQQSNQQD